MKCLIVSEEALVALDDLNVSGSPARQLYPFGLSDGRYALNADLVGDSGAGQTWEHYGEFLRSLETGEIPSEEFKTAEADKVRQPRLEVIASVRQALRATAGLEK